MRLSVCRKQGILIQSPLKNLQTPDHYITRVLIISWFIIHDIELKYRLTLELPISGLHVNSV